VREALAEELNQLKDFNAPDIIGISAKLLVLESKVKDLPLFLPHAERAEENHERPAKPGEADQKEKGWSSSALKDLKGLVTVRHTDKSVQAILAPEEVAALKQVMLLKLEMSRAALLRGDDELFKANMESAIAWLNENFDAEASVTQDLREELKVLQNVQLHVEFPKISTSLGLLRDIEKLRLEAEKGHPVKVGKANTKPEKAPEDVPPAQPAPQPAPTPAPPPASSNLPAAEPLPEEGANP
jgi:uncharacterized protein HemX